jgi:hypothetical protein
VGGGVSQRTDMAYGRQGGRIVEGAPTNLTNSRRCDVCGEPMHGGQRSRHHLCDPTSIVGRACTCPPGCTVTVVGDQGTCDATCVPCTLYAGKIHSNVAEWKRRKS